MIQEAAGVPAIMSASYVAGMEIGRREKGVPLLLVEPLLSKQISRGAGTVWAQGYSVGKTKSLLPWYLCSVNTRRHCSFICDCANRDGSRGQVRLESPWTHRVGMDPYKMGLWLVLICNMVRSRLFWTSGLHIPSPHLILFILNQARGIEGNRMGA